MLNDVRSAFSDDPISHRRRAHIGIAAQTVPLPRRVALALGAGRRAVCIAEVELGGPATSAGLREGDVLLSLDGIAITGTDDLIRLLGAHRIGRETVVSFLRDGSLKRLSLRAVERGSNGVMVAVQTSLLSCRKAGKTRLFTPILEFIWGIPG
jgi:S1-C subfamily serine protease